MEDELQILDTGKPEHFIPIAKPAFLPKETKDL
jgi:hypothetical protein